MQSIDKAEFRAALQARNRAIGYYLFDPNVSLIDVGLRIKERERRLVLKEATVRVHVRHKPRGAAFEAFAAAYPERVVEEDKIGFAVDIVEGDYRLQQWFWPPPPPRGRAFDPLHGGISISNEWSFGYGTLGGVVIDRETEKEMILSNYHVLAGSSFAPPGLRIYQPGYGDGGRRQHTVARLTRHSMNVGIDAAVAELTHERETTNNQFELGSVTGVGEPMPDMRVKKSGRASKVTRGIITGVGGVRAIPYGGIKRVVQHVVHIAKVPDSDQVSAPGDSGSWWLEESTDKVVGLHFAGSNVPEYGLAIRMANVLNALNVDLML
jgi:hypothetical protein